MRLSEKPCLRGIATFLVLMMFTSSILTVAPVQTAEACASAAAICSGAYLNAAAHCARPCTSLLSCLKAMVVASIICAAAHALCPDD